MIEKLRGLGKTSYSNMLSLLYLKEHKHTLYCEFNYKHLHCTNEEIDEAISILENRVNSNKNKKVGTNEST